MENAKKKVTKSVIENTSNTEDLSNWKAPLRPAKHMMMGAHCSLEPINVALHADELWQAYTLNTDALVWQYLPYGPFHTYTEFIHFLQSLESDDDNIFFAIQSHKHQQALGYIAYSRIDESIGSIEIAHVCFSPLLQKTTAATEAVYLMVNGCFSLGYRRCEWKCNTLNAPSKKAAMRFGFQYEGCFRQATIVKGQNRDTDWFSIIDKEWPTLKHGYQHWLADNNFDDKGQQRHTLSSLLN